ncbi:MFS transporter [Marinobacterium sp. BA1]|uniref:MFS transporter n=1 Tax=Marinobacterium sp. BA1 TaxID=3138931 RepID=UPI0032E79B17
MKSINHRPVPFTLFLGFISSLGPLSIDMGLPGLSDIENFFQLATGKGALTFSFFVAGLAVSPLLGGILSDRFGRKPVILFSLLLYTLAAQLCSLAPGFELLLGSRLLQGLAAGLCLAIPIAIIRDTLEGEAARLRISYMIMLVGIAPLVAPLLGSLVMQFGPWQRIHDFQAVIGLLSLLIITFTFTETLPIDKRQTLNVRDILAELNNIMAKRVFLLATLIYTLGFCTLFTYVSASSSLFVDHYGFSIDQLALIMAFTSGLAGVGSWFNAQLAKRGVTTSQVILIGLLCMLVPAFILLFMPNVQALLLGSLMAFILLGFGLLSPAANHMAMDVIGQGKGKASGVMRLFQMSSAALISALYTLLIGMVGSITATALLVLVCALLGLKCWLSLIRCQQHA